MSSRRSRRSTNHPKYVEDYPDVDITDTNDRKQNMANDHKNKNKGAIYDNANLNEEADINEEDEEVEEEEVTRCICGSIDLQVPKRNNNEFQNVDPGFFIQCEKCAVWQHGYCVGIKDEDNAPEKYWCEQCKPQFHTLFTDKFNIRRSKYDPLNPHKVGGDNSHRRGIKRKNGRSTRDNDDHSGENLDDESTNNNHTNDDANNENENNNSLDHSLDNDNNDDENDNDHKRKHRRRSSYYSYEEQLKKALLESAKEANVAPDDVNISASDGHETFERDLRRNLRAKSNLHPDNNIDNEAIENDTTSDSNITHIKNEKIDTTKKSKDKRFKSSRTPSNDENEDEPTTNETTNETKVKVKTPSPQPSNRKDLKRSSARKPNARRETKSPNKPQIDKTDDKPFRANIPSARININEMTRRIFSIMDFVSNIQLNLSNEEEFKNNLFKMNNDDLSPEVVVLKKTLTECYNDSVTQLDSLTKLLNDWQNDHI